TAVTFQRPQISNSAAPALAVNIVAVRELDTPDGEEAVEWLLITNEPITTDAEVLRVVDCYRARWLIEEFFKSLKTGCAFEKRQLDSLDTLKKALALLIPIAWSLLRLRSVARTENPPPATTVLPPTELEVLILAAKRVGFVVPPSPTARDVMLAIAKLGGHIRSN